jgi:hypothetical protein
MIMQKFLQENLYPANGVDSYGITRSSGGVLNIINSLCIV